MHFRKLNNYDSEVLVNPLLISSLSNTLHNIWNFPQNYQSELSCSVKVLSLIECVVLNFRTKPFYYLKEVKISIVDLFLSDHSNIFVCLPQFKKTRVDFTISQILKCSCFWAHYVPTTRGGITSFFRLVSVIGRFGKRASSSQKRIL